MRKFSILTIFAFLVLPIMSCNAQNKDNPAVAIVFPPKVSTYYGADKMKFIKEAPVIEAYHLKNDISDTSATALYGFKILKRIPRLSPAHTDSLKKILADSINYGLTPSVKRCGLPADLAFKFVKGNESLIIFIATKCDVMYSTLGNTPKKDFLENTPENITDCNNAHNKYLAIAKQLFPEQYRNIPYRETNQTVVNNNTQITANDSIVSDTIANPNVRSEKTHKVAKGESIKDIAKKYSVKEADLLKWNNLKDKNLKEGTLLVVSAPKTHKVQKGESLKDIAKTYSIKEDELMKLNKLKSKEVKEGDVLIIRNEK